MFDDPLSLLSAIIWLAVLGTWPVAFLFGACSPCCNQDLCPWLLQFDRCLRYETPDVTPVPTSNPAGWRGDSRVSLQPFTTDGVERMAPGIGSIAIFRVQSQITITVRISLSASGASRTPVGETRTQVWRFNRATPTSPPATAYDVLGPAWHLEVELSVTGVATQEEAGVTTSIGVDSEGQPKLFVVVNQWTATITRDEVVTLFPVGLQRWGPGLAGTQSFRLTTSTATATLVSGDSYSGWTVSKLSGLSIGDLAYALRITLFTGAVFLDNDAVVEFLNGDRTFEVFREATTGVPAGFRELRITPDNPLCGIIESAVEVGVALGIYPEAMTLTLPGSFADNFDEGEICEPDGIPMRLAASSSTTQCLDRWRAYYYRRRVNFQFPLIVQGFGVEDPFLEVRAVPREFYAGGTLLWNFENGPSVTSITIDSSNVSSKVSTFNQSDRDRMIGATISLGGDSGFSIYDTPRGTTCPPGATNRTVFSEQFPTESVDRFSSEICTPQTSTPFSQASEIPVNLNWQASLDVVTDASADSACANEVLTIETKSVSGTSAATLTRRQSEVRNGVRCIVYSGGWGETIDDGFSKDLFNTQFGEPISCGGVAHAGANIGGFVVAYFSVPCEDSGDLTLVAIELETFPPQARDVRRTFTIGIPSISLTELPEGQASASVGDVPAVPFVEVRRTVCTNWSLDVIPPEGATVTRTCSDQYGGSLFTSPSLTQSFGESRTRFPRIIHDPFQYVGSSSMLREGNCKLLGIIPVVGTGQGFSVSPTISGTTIFVSAQAGLCYYLSPSFGSGFTAAGTGDANLCFAPSGARIIPCDDCELSVLVVSGEENARVDYLTQGDKAGLIQIIPTRTWLGGQGVTLTVACGGDAITRTIRRVDTVPTPPQNLTVVRDPCSQAVIQWEPPEGDGGQPITSYIVDFRRIGVSSFTAFATVSPTTFSATITGLGRVGYEFRVRAVTSVGTSPQAVVTSGFALGAPTNLTFTRDPCDQAQLSWTPPVQAECVVVANYRLEYREIFDLFGSGGPYITFSTISGTATTGTITGLDPTLRYQFRVARVADDGPDQFASSSTSGTPPTAPTGVVAALGATPGEVDLTWNAVEQLCFPNTDYLVQFRPDTTSTWSDFTRAASTDKFATVSGLTAGVTYFFRVRAINVFGNSLFSLQSNSVTIP